ncbi:MAG: DEAD/DEAH box helicase family protein [Nitrososphaeria archaeon]
MSRQHTLDGKELYPQIELDLKLKSAVSKWKQESYKGATDVTKRLLRYWFFEQHYDERGRELEFWQNQKEAIEALIYVYEVMKLHSLNDLLNAFEVSLPLTYQRPWPVYGFKMATGSGKTIVMEMAIVWQYFNNYFGSDNGVRYSNRFLVLAPNLIVLDRLYDGSFKDLREIKTLPFIPPEWKDYFDCQVILQAEKIRKTGKGVIYLTNIQQLYEKEKEPINPVDELLGNKPKSEDDPLTGWEYLLTSLSSEKELMIINDEAHHVYYDFPSEWYNSIKNIDEELRKRFGNGITLQLDFSATPKDRKGVFWSHIIYDYPLRKAIIDRIVKKVHIGIMSGVPKPPSDDYVTKYKAQIDVGLEKLREIKKELSKIKKKPVMFIMCDTNKHADQVAKYLENETDFKGRVLLIHTDSSGEITKKELPALRKAAREIDTNEYEIIVSVMMLKEGWDVRNVVVIVPLRAFDSPLLPEQTLGRGLRKMQPHLPNNEETLLVIDHPRFRQLWDAEIKQGDLEAKIEDIEKVKPDVHAIFPDPQKLQYDIEIPLLEGGVLKWAPDFSKIDLNKLEKGHFRINEIEVPKIRYTEKDLLSQKIVKEEELAFDYTDNYDLYLSYMVNAILKRNRLPKTHFPELLPLVNEYIQNYLFTEKFDITNPDLILKLNSPIIRECIANEFSKAIRELYIQEETPAYITRRYRVSDTQVIHTSKSEDMLYPPKKSVFNLIPADSQFEIDFMKYLDRQDDVIAYTKVMKNMMPLHIMYYDMQNCAHYYIPDFIVKAKCGLFIIETKGRELDLKENVRYKDKAADNWCKRIRELTKENWRYVKIVSDDFYSNNMLSFCTLVKNVGYQIDLDKYTK